MNCVCVCMICNPQMINDIRQVSCEVTSLDPQALLQRKDLSILELTHPLSAVEAFSLQQMLNIAQVAASRDCSPTSIQHFSSQIMLQEVTGRILMARNGLGRSKHSYYLILVAARPGVAL